MTRLRHTLVLAFLVVLAGLIAVPAYAQVPGDDETPSESESSEPTGEDHFVEVGDEGFFPVEISIQPGDRVVWSWVGERAHSVTAAPDATNAREFDSHPGCPDLFGGGCGQPGETFVHTFADGGIYRYGSRANGDEAFAARVTVVAPQPSVKPTPAPSPSESASPKPTASPSPSPTTTTSPSPTTSPAPLPTTTGTETEGTPTLTDTPTSTPVPQRGSAPVFGRAPVAQPQQPIDQPLVAGASGIGEATEIPSPEFEEFPDAADLSASETEAPDEVIIAAPGGDGGPGRLVWGLLGSGLLVGTMGAFSRLVLFGDAWAN